MLPVSSPLELSIIIAARNSGRDLDVCLPSIRAGTAAPHEIIIVDNASSDGTAAWLRRAWPAIVLIENTSNRGHCHAINRGLEAASAEFVLVLDADTVIWPGAIDRLVAFARGNPEAVIVAPRMLNADGSVQETARRFPRPINALFGRQTLLTRLFPRNRFSAGYLRRSAIDRTEAFEVDWVSAACMLFRRNLVSTLGLWDEGFGGYWVDADWCRRAHSAGHVFCDPSAHVSHVEQHRSGRKKDAARIIQFHAGAHRFYRKHYTNGWLDPRALATGLALAGRAAAVVLANRLRRTAPTPVAVSTPALNRIEGIGTALDVAGDVDSGHALQPITSLRKGS
jgi:GT2 family glycosyltransferase